MLSKITFIICILLSSNIYAQSFLRGKRIGGVASTTGIGAELSYQAEFSTLSSWRLRGAYTTVAFDKTQQFGMDKGKSIDLRPNLQKKVAQVLLDYFPFSENAGI
jgi:hypothetical protein